MSAAQKSAAINPKDKIASVNMMHLPSWNKGCRGRRPRSTGKEYPRAPLVSRSSAAGARPITRGRPPDNPRAPPALPGYPRRPRRPGNPRIPRPPARPGAPRRPRAPETRAARAPRIPAPPALPGYPRRLERRPGRPPAPARARAAKSLSAKSLSAKSLSMMLERKNRIWIDSKIPDCKLPLKFPRFFILIPRRRSL